MRDTKLILIEGLPGAGKSTTAHFLARHLARQAIPHRWWYEEERGHPLAVFDDRASLRRVVEALSSGQHRPVVAAVLDRWRQLAARLRAADEIVLLDGCLFGHLTWSLFPAGVPEAEIHAYLAEVERIIAGCAPCLIALDQEDVAAALRRICARRGGDTAERFIRNATASAYGRRRGLAGFDGLVAFWRDYRALTDAAFARIGFPKLAIEVGGGDWANVQRRVADFLGLPPAAEATAPDASLEQFTGRYRDRDGDKPPCTISLDGGSLVLDGVAGLWPRSRLIPTGPGLFEIESFPLAVAFAADAAGATATMTIAGRGLLFEDARGRFVRERDDRV